MVYNAIDRQLFKPFISHPAPLTSEPYVLCVSSIDPRKNFARLIEACQGLTDAKLYIVGKYNRVFSQQMELDTTSEHIHFLGRVSDDELVRLYNVDARPNIRDYHVLRPIPTTMLDRVTNKDDFKQNPGY